MRIYGVSQAVTLCADAASSPVTHLHWQAGPQIALAMLVTAAAG
jgi:hypothetical protein